MMKKSTKRKIYLIAAIVAALSVVAEIMFAHPHGSEIWHTIPGADIVISFVGGWILMLTATKIMAPILQRREDYYDGGDKKDE